MLLSGSIWEKQGSFSPVNSVSCQSNGEAMVHNKQLSIFLYTGYTPRATALMNRIKKACGNKAAISLIDSESSILEKRTGDSNSIVILDLPNIKQPAVQTVTLVKNSVTKSKILAIHIYTTKLLINPLLDAGIHGYLTYEPEPVQIQTAIDTVLADKIFIPAEIEG